MVRQVGSDVHSLTFNVWTEFRPIFAFWVTRIDPTAQKVLKIELYANHSVLTLK